MGRHRKEATNAVDDNAELKDAMRQHILTHLDELFEDIDALEPKERVDRRLRLMDYFMPKVQAIRTEEVKSTSVAEALLSRSATYEDDAD